MKKEDYPKLSLRLDNNSGVTTPGKTAASVVDPADALHGHLEITSRKNVRISAALIHNSILLCKYLVERKTGDSMVSGIPLARITARL